VSATGETPDNAAEVLADFRSRCDTIEQAYEFFLAYASQGLPADHAGASGEQARDYLRRCDTALNGLGDSLTGAIDHLSVDAAPYHAFIRVIDRDARDAQAAVQLVMAQRFVGSAMIDNLNASIHLRALLTDLFLIDEALKTHAR
jgi:hypothetical protein